VRARGSLRWGLAILVAFGLLAPGVAGADEAEQIYDPGALVEIDLGLSPEAEAALETEPFEDVKATFTARLTDGVPGGSTTLLVEDHPVEVRLKGHLSGSFRPLSQKAAFKLKFKKSERFLGLRKMTLNNMVEDPSMVHETLAYGLFRAAGVPASRTGFAYLRVNGEDYGVYLDLENVDETFLAAHYGAGNTMHLYEGEYGADADAAGVAAVEAEVPEGEPKFEMDEGEGSPTDLEALADAVAAASPSFSARLAGLADLDEMARMWAVEKYVSHWDGYSGEEDANKPNNYYLHSDLAGQFQMLPWGTDNTWQVGRRIGFDGHAGLLFNGCLGDAACFDRYCAALRALQGQVEALDPDRLAASTAALLKPWQELEEDESTRGERSVAEIEAAVAKVRQYVAERPGELSAWLAANESPSEESGSGPAGQTATGGQGSTGKAPALPALSLAGIARRPGELRLRVRLRAPGRVRAWISIQTKDGRRRACAPDVATDTAGMLVLPCRFPDFVQRRLRHRWLRMRLVLRLIELDGTTETTVRQVRVPRG
jgi:CotH kinase protein